MECRYRSTFLREGKNNNMSISRIYQLIPLQVSARVRLDEKASHHLARVLRAKVGEKLTLFNGEGGEYLARITQIDKKGVEVEVLQFSEREAESPLTIHLAQGIARGEKMDFIVQKAVELGVNNIIPLITERCNVRFDEGREEKRLAHWQSVVVSACEQSGRNRVPRVLPPVRLEKWFSEIEVDVGFVLSPHVQVKLSSIAIDCKSVALLIGPEGGLSEQEIEMAMRKGFLPLNLGPRVLRTETATLAAVTMVQGWLGDMNHI